MLFDSTKMPPPEKKRVSSKKAMEAALLSAFVFCFMVNGMPVMAQALEGVPGLGSLVRVVNLRTYEFGWGDTALRATLPKVELVGDGTGCSAQTPSSDTAPEPTDAISEKSQSSAISGTISWESDGTTSTVPSRPKTSN